MTIAQAADLESWQISSHGWSADRLPENEEIVRAWTSVCTKGARC